VDRRIEPPHLLCSHSVEEGCAPGAYAGQAVLPDPAVRAAIAPALAAAAAIRSRPVGVHVDAPFPVEKRAEAALGNLFADILREGPPKADVAFANAGSVRDTLPAGDLTVGQLHHVMPFDNHIAHLHVTARQLSGFLAKALVQEHGLPAVSGVRASARCVNGQVEVVLRAPTGALLDPDRPLVVATNDFIALGGDGLLEPAAVGGDKIEIIDGSDVRETLVHGLSTRGHVTPGDPALFDPNKPRWELPGPPPLHCP